MESGLNSGFWAPPAVVGRVVTDMVATAGQYAVTSATANFTSADRGRTVIIQGAGTSGALLIASVQTVNSATGVSLTLFNPIPTTVNPATATIVDAVTEDGIHPKPPMAALMAAAINTKLFI